MPAKKPINLIVAEGKSHYTKEEIERRQAEEAAIAPKSDNIRMPSWLVDPVAKKEYKRIVKQLKDIDIMTNLDVDLLAMYCQAYAQYQKATEELRNQPLMITKYDKFDRPYQVENPLIKIQIKYSDEIKKIASQMGLSISSRIKMVPPKTPEKPANKFDDLNGN